MRKRDMRSGIRIVYTLVDSMKAAQSDPYRHDPSTLSLFQAAILDAWRYMRDNAAHGCSLFQVPKDRTSRRTAHAARLREIEGTTRTIPLGALLLPPSAVTYQPTAAVGSRLHPCGRTEIEPSDVLAFALLIQFINVDRQLKWDMKYMSQRRGCTCGDVDHLSFYEFDPSPEARNAFAITSHASGRCTSTRSTRCSTSKTCSTPTADGRSCNWRWRSRSRQASSTSRTQRATPANSIWTSRPSG